ncbi:inositol monophosphatase family protein [Nakamurella endophytica]|uniref:Histidinol-phosphatase n=1 Tax=Nakamurella endophytica TaxID=1748367 RepID=A0A917WJ08_9ACTN|nr:inositol monophosphatase family protein [Nakamurella endophytica]GGM07584.1 histidinol-phosphatase [Nakamurella endophytica]
MTRYGDDLALALQLADAADAISIDRFGAGDLRVEAKPDLSPVSDADLAVERALRGVLERARPGDTVLGEEFGGAAAATSSAGERRWILDPIDGTKNYVRGVPVWATLIALFDGDLPAVGVVSAPALARRWWAAEGDGAWGSVAGAQPRRLHVSGVRRLEDASVSYSEVGEWAAAGRGDRFAALLDQAWRTRAYGDFWSYVLVAEGAVDVAAEPELSLWDLAALVPVVREAGGRLTGVDGSPIGLHSTSALATNGLLHPAVTALLNP